MSVSYHSIVLHWSRLGVDSTCTVTPTGEDDPLVIALLERWRAEQAKLAEAPRDPMALL